MSVPVASDHDCASEQHAGDGEPVCIGAKFSRVKGEWGETVGLPVTFVLHVEGRVSCTSKLASLGSSLLFDIAPRWWWWWSVVAWGAGTTEINAP